MAYPIRNTVSMGQIVTTALQRAREDRGWSQSRLILEIEVHAKRQGVQVATRASLKTMLSRWENGAPIHDLYRRIFCNVFHASESDLGFDGPGIWAPQKRDLNSQVAMSKLEALRIDLNEAISGHTVSPAVLDTWEESAAQLATNARHYQPDLLVIDLASDLAELRSALSRGHSASAMRRLTRVAALMAGLMCLTLIKLDERDSFRKWARTARIAAEEIGDAETSSWVFAQEAYGHYYAGDFPRAIALACRAQELAHNNYYVGGVLAAALEARAQASMGRSQETHDALHRAESALSHLRDRDLGTSAFSYNEAQLRFHEGNAYTHLHDTRAAWEAQQRALELYPMADYLDRALIVLDRASCLAEDGDVSGAVEHALQSLAELSESQRRGIITLRAQEIISSLSSRGQQLATTREFQELLALPAEAGKENE